MKLYPMLIFLVFYSNYIQSSLQGKIRKTKTLEGKHNQIQSNASSKIYTPTDLQDILSSKKLHHADIVVGYIYYKWCPYSDILLSKLRKAKRLDEVKIHILKIDCYHFSGCQEIAHHWGLPSLVVFFSNHNFARINNVDI